MDRVKGTIYAIGGIRAVFDPHFFSHEYWFRNESEAITPWVSLELYSVLSDVNLDEKDE